MQTSNPVYQIMLADDHIILRDALANLMNEVADFHVCGLAANGEEVKHLLKNGPAPDVILLDLNMPVMDGYETAHWLAKNHPEVKILILTMYDSEIALIRLLQEGVRGFLKKDIHPQELRHAIKTVCEDGYYYAHSTTNKLASLFKKNAGQPHKLEKSMLTDIEIEFLKLASTDLTYKEIAMQMKLTTRVVDNYRDVLFEKLDVKSRVGLAIYAVKNGILQL